MKIGYPSIVSQSSTIFKISPQLTEEMNFEISYFHDVGGPVTLTLALDDLEGNM